MDAFTTFTAVAVPLDAANVDTDQIIPAPFLSRPRADGDRRGRVGMLDRPTP